MLNPTEPPLASILAQLPKFTSQGATLDGPLKSRGPLTFLTQERTFKPSALLFHRSTFPYREVAPSFLSQNQKDATCHPKKWQPLKKLATFRF